jgi:myo-inositol 2-dehydrogenase/D-chiro-inositol 1-dehydrogenase
MPGLGSDNDAWPGPRTLRLAIAGCGRIAEVGYLPALAALPDAELVGIADPSPARRSVVARAASDGVAAHDSVDAMLEAGGVDGLIVATPADTHVPIAELAAAAGIPALVEKPPASNGAAARRLAEQRPTPWIGFNRRFDQGLELRERIPADGRLDVTAGLSYRRRSWRPVCDPPDALLDLGAHVVDLSLFLCDAAPLAVRSAALSAERAELELETSRGLARLECETGGRHREIVEVRGADGALVARSVRGGLARGIVQRARGADHPLVRSLAGQVESFASTLRGGAAGPLATARDGLTAMRVLDAAREADAAGAPVRLGRPEPLPA